MEKATLNQSYFNELQQKWFLNDMKRKIIQTVCFLMDDEVYTKNDAVCDLLDVIASIDMEEKKIHPNEVREQSFG